VSAAIYPATTGERNRWISERRGSRNQVSSDGAFSVIHEQERTIDGQIEDVLTVFLTNRECPWKCVMCDLWRNTTESPATPGAIPRQIEQAIEGAPESRILKLYNSGSFFDSGAIPREDWRAIANLCNNFDHLIVESHPLLINAAVLDFAALLNCSLEVAMGLETCHPRALDAINKRMRPEDFQRAASFLCENGISVRTFLLVNPPFIPNQEQPNWIGESLRFALDAGSSVISLIPARMGNGALDELARAGEFREPSLGELEDAHAYGLRLANGKHRVFADLWDLDRFSSCSHCAGARRERLHRMNLSQQIEPRVSCQHCGDGNDPS
jgi:radical SAM enzyme (TIGR01210 family)